MIIADLHIHSRFSRATSRDLTPEALDLWARRKGIGLLGTGDFTHQAWRRELAEKLEPAEDGLYRLRGAYRLCDAMTPETRPRFVISGEISSIYKKNGKTRKVHNVILLPGLEAADELSRRLEAIGNIHSDGRPILGLDSRDLLEITLDACPEAIFIPAHIWTPHFSLFGAFSGFDTIEECFEDLTPHIHALETGLSSDPPMNWRLSALDGYTLVSNSDAHSPSKLGREANLLDIDLSYPSLSSALKTGNGFCGTIEFFPEEGKYHLDGHRSCGLCLTPAETIAYDGKCPVCGKKITIGVEHRVEELADRAAGFLPKGAPRFESLVPLPEVIAGSTGRTTASKKVTAQFEALLASLGTEFHILREAPIEDVCRAAGPCVAEGVRRLREGKVRRSPGFDGEYGKIELLSRQEIDELEGQLCLIPGGLGAAEKHALPHAARKTQRQEPAAAPSGGLNPAQLAAATAEDGVTAVVAGPGTGKTKTLISRAVWLIAEKGVNPSELTLVTFTNKAAEEMRARLTAELGKQKARRVQIGTFHALCLAYLNKSRGPVTLLAEQDALELAEETVPGLPPRRVVEGVSRRKNGLETDLSEEAFDAYTAGMDNAGVLDFDDLLLETLADWEAGVPAAVSRAFSHLLVDEFQDLNPVQFRLAEAWGAGAKSYFAIGDPDQAIYGFRGADAHCFAHLHASHPAAREIRLTENYRSTPEILSCALPVISRNSGSERVLHPNRQAGARVRVVTSESPMQEGIFIAKEIGRMVGGIDMLEAESHHTRREHGPHRGFSDIAILYRTHHQSYLIEKCLRHDGIPCVVAGRDDWLAADEVRGVSAFFRYLLNPADEVSLALCLHLIWGVPKGVAAQPPAFLEAAEAFQPRVRQEKPAALIESLAARLGLEETDAVSRLVSAAALYHDMEGFLETLLIGQEADVVRAGGKSYDSGAVTLMTLHGAKGLEFPAVFLAGVNEGCVPLEAKGRDTDPEEERRLFYVGMTRAKEELLILTSPEPSPFLSELPAAAPVREAASAKRRPAGEQPSLFDL